MAIKYSSMKQGTHIDRFLLALAFAMMAHLILLEILLGNIVEMWRIDGSVVEIEYLDPLVANKFIDEGSIETTEERRREELHPNQPMVEEKEEAEEKEVQEEKGQIVYIGETENNRPPEKYRYLAEYNSLVDKETVSRYAKNDYKNPAPRPQIGENAMSHSHPKKGKMPAPDLVIRKKDENVERPEEMREDKRLALKVPRLLKSDELKMEEAEDGIKKNLDFSEQLNGKDNEFQFGTSLEKGETLHKKRLAQLFSEDIFSGRYSGGPFNDWLKDLEESDATFLNAKEYKYASFFNRIKSTVSQYWRPSDVILKYDPYGNIYGNRDRLTVVKVKIDAGGNLKEIDVSQSSGIDFLDKVAVDAFRAAQPFPNPPKGLMDKDGNITFNFGFYVEFSRSLLRLFRYE